MRIRYINFEAHWYKRTPINDKIQMLLKLFDFEKEIFPKDLNKIEYDRENSYIKDIIETIKETPTLIELNDSADKLLKMIEHRQHLKNLDLDYNDIDYQIERLNVLNSQGLLTKYNYNKSVKASLVKVGDNIKEANYKKENLLRLNDSLEKLIQLIDAKTEIMLILPMLEKIDTKLIDDVKGKNNYYSVIKQMNMVIDAHLEKLKLLYSLGSLTKIVKVTNPYISNLNDKGRLECCDELITESKSNIPKYDKTFIGSIDKPTLNYFLGGKKPDKIIKIQMGGSHQKVFDLLLEHSSHLNKDGEKCIPNFVRKEFCPKILLSKEGNSIKQLNNKSNYIKE